MVGICKCISACVLAENLRVCERERERERVSESVVNQVSE